MHNDLILTKVEAVNIKGNKNHQGITIKSVSEVPYSKDTGMYKLYKKAFYVFTCEAVKHVDSEIVESLLLNYGIKMVTLMDQHETDEASVVKLMCRPIRTVNIKNRTKIMDYID